MCGYELNHLNYNNHLGNSLFYWYILHNLSYRPNLTTKATKHQTKNNLKTLIFQTTAVHLNDIHLCL